MSKTILKVEVSSSAQREQSKNEYLEKAGPISKEYGGNNFMTFLVNEHIGGHASTHLVLLMEFPSLESIKNMFLDERYVELIPIREKAFSVITYSILNELGTKES